MKGLQELYRPNLSFSVEETETQGGRVNSSGGRLIGGNEQICADLLITRPVGPLMPLTNRGLLRCHKRADVDAFCS